MKKTLTTKDQSKSNDKANDKNPNPKKLEPSKKYKQLTFFWFGYTKGQKE